MLDIGFIEILTQDQLNQLLTEDILDYYSNVSKLYFDTNDFLDNGLGSTTHVSIIDRWVMHHQLQQQMVKVWSYYTRYRVILNNMLGEQD